MGNPSEVLDWRTTINVVERAEAARRNERVFDFLADCGCANSEREKFQRDILVESIQEESATRAELSSAIGYAAGLATYEHLSDIPERDKDRLVLALLAIVRNAAECVVDNDNDVYGVGL